MQKEKKPNCFKVFEKEFFAIRIINQESWGHQWGNLLLLFWGFEFLNKIQESMKK